MSEEELSHDDYIKRGILDYENSYDDWDAELLIDHIIILKELQSRMVDLIIRMKNEILEKVEK